MRFKMDKKTITKYSGYILLLLLFVILYLFFSIWGIIGYIVFVFTITSWILYKRREEYKLVTKWGAKELDKVFGGNTDGKRKN